MKPVAMTSNEGLQIKQALDKSGAKAVVSHQRRYGEHYKKVKEIVAAVKKLTAKEVKPKVEIKKSTDG